MSILSYSWKINFFKKSMAKAEQIKKYKRICTYFRPNFTFLFSTIKSQMYVTDRYRKSLMSCPRTLSNSCESAFLKCRLRRRDSDERENEARLTSFQS